MTFLLPHYFYHKILGGRKHSAPPLSKSWGCMSAPTPWNLILTCSTINKLTGKSRLSYRLCPDSANYIASQLVKNRAYRTGNLESTKLVNKEVSDIWTVPTPEGDIISGRLTKTFGILVYIPCVHIMGVGRIFSSEGSSGFSRWGQKWWNFILPTPN